jgi:hypothetical protein
MCVTTICRASRAGTPRFVARVERSETREEETRITQKFPDATCVRASCRRDDARSGRNAARQRAGDGPRSGKVARRRADHGPRSADVAGQRANRGPRRGGVARQRADDGPRRRNDAGQRADAMALEGASLPVEGATMVPEDATLPVEGATSAVEGATLPVKGATSALEGATLPVKGPTMVLEGATVPVKAPRTACDGASGLSGFPCAPCRQAPGRRSPRARERPAPGWRSRGVDLQRHQPIGLVVAQAAEHRGHAAQGGLRADAAGFAQGDELGWDFNQQDIFLISAYLPLSRFDIGGPRARPTRNNFLLSRRAGSSPPYEFSGSARKTDGVALVI